MTLYKCILISYIQALMCCGIFCSTALAQEANDNYISIEANALNFTEVLQLLEAKTDRKFYYREEDIPNEQYSFSIKEQSLDFVLNLVLRKTALSYLAYDDFAIVIGPKNIIDESYSAEYYKILEEKDQESNTEIQAEQLIQVGDISSLSSTGTARIKGLIRDALNQDPIIGATVFWPDLDIGTSTDVMGEFEIELRSGRHEMKIEYIGYEDFVKVLAVDGNGEFLVDLQPEAYRLEEVLVKAEAVNVNVESADIGVERLDVQAIKKLPSFMGEADVVKSLLLQPGVSSVGEGAIGFNVRGGQIDQNLVMQDEAFLFNTSHALGFFSTFNPELISFVTLYKGSMPSEFGGRLASVLDVEMRDGSYRKFKLNGGIGPVSTKLAIEGPIVKEKTSFIVGFRSTYSDWILNLINVPEVKNSSAFFYDFNVRVTHKFNDNHTLTLSGYSSEDRFSYNEEFGFDYQTQLGQLILKSIFSDRVFNKFTASVSEYSSDQLDLSGTDASTLNTNLSYAKFKNKLSIIPSSSLQLDVGLSSILYRVMPGDLSPEGRLSQIIPRALKPEKGVESALFINSSWTINEKISLNAGLRLSMYQYLGPASIFEYSDELRPSLETVTGVTEYGKNEIISGYGAMEPRLSMRYKLDEDSSMKLGYSRTTQYINLISNTNTPTPGSQWQLSTEYIQPQRANNFSVGYFRNYDDNDWETSIELYARQIDDLFDFKNFAQLSVNENIETELLPGIGRAFGAELSIKKRKGTFNGSLSYTLSRSQKQVEGINNLNWYPSNFDKPHDLSVIFNIQPNTRNTISFNFNYSTGRPTTAPIASYKEENGFVVPIYSNRNQLRIPAYHRLDLAYTLGQSFRKDRKFRTSWTFSIYNLYGRSNAFSVFFTQKPFNRPVANQLAILGSAFPALTINIVSL